jgi:hypothetical protein
MNKKLNELKDEKLRDIHGGYENIFKFYGIWDQLTAEEQELVNSMIKRDRELADPSVPFETWLAHAEYQDKTERRILLKYGITNIYTDDL